MAEFLAFRIDGFRFGLQVTAVERVIPAVEISPLPNAPSVTLGVIRVRGALIPVVNLRGRLALPARELALADRFIITRTSRRKLAIVADAVDGVLELPGGAIGDAAELVPGIRQVAGIAGDRGGVLFIHDIESFLSASEEVALDRALVGGGMTPDGPHAA